MIRPDDFAVAITPAERGVCVCVTHKPTGHQRTADLVADDSVGKTRDSLIAELRRLLFAPEDIRVDTGSSSNGDFIRVLHVPSGIERWALRCNASKEDLLDDVLEELWGGDSSPKVTDGSLAQAAPSNHRISKLCDLAQLRDR